MLKIAGLPIEIVILRSPYLNITDPLTAEMFTKMMLLKYKGYHNRHLEGTLPLDATDFVADHPLICVRHEKLGLIPITGSKVITYDTCRFFNMDFALESCFKKGGNTTHLNVLYEIIESAQKNNRTIAYHGGYTIDSDIVKTPEDREIARKLFMGISALYFKENNISELLGFGVPKYKTEQFFYQWGYNRCKINEKDLEEFPVYFLPGANGILMHLKEFSSGINEISEQFRFIWKQKIDLKNDQPKKEKARIA